MRPPRVVRLLLEERALATSARTTVKSGHSLSGGAMNAASSIEQVGVIFLNHRQFRAALVSLCEAAAARAASPWYPIGNALLMLSTETEADAITRLRLSLSTLRRALKESPENRLASELIELIETRSPLTAEDCSSCRPFEGNPRKIPPLVGAGPSDLVKGFGALKSWKDRMGI